VQSREKQGRSKNFWGQIMGIGGEGLVLRSGTKLAIKTIGLQKSEVKKDSYTE
jgi:hypothetical protein